MAIGITTDPFKPGTGSISFGEIAARYSKTKRNVKASAYLRDTSDLGTNSAKLVKNATENSAVVTSTDDAWSVGDLRNTITSYVVTHHTDDSLKFDATSADYWNDNLSKNITKKFNLNNDSNFYSDEVGEYALEFDADMRNLTISIAGGVYGARGSGGVSAYADGGDGGDALYVNNSYTNGNVLLKINPNGRILAGGGGGGGGGNSPNKTLACDKNEDVSFNVKSYIESTTTRYPRYSEPITTTIIYGSKVQRDSYNTWNAHCNGNAPNEPEVFGNRPAFRAGTPNEVNYVFANENSKRRSRCRGSTYRSRSSAYTCTDHWNVTCRGTFDDSLTATGGTGGSGGTGAGYYSGQIRSAQGGVEGNPGEKINCANRSTSVTTVAGGDGGDGGSYGQDGGAGGLSGGQGGAGGDAILRKNVSIEGRTSTTVKGDIVDI